MCDHDRHNSDFYIRTCFADASAALSEIDKGRAIGGGLCLREACHRRLDLLGRFLLSHAGKVLFVWMLMVATFSVGLKSSQFTSRLEELWLPDAGRIGEELSYTMKYLGETDTWNNLMVIQMPGAQSEQSNYRNHHYTHNYNSGRRSKYIEEDEDDNILTRDAFLAHLNILKKASQVTVQLFDTDWKLKDVCHSASMPTSESAFVTHMLDTITPCIIITPLDCFWEGSKLLGPDYPLTIPGLDQKIKWTNLDPQKIMTQTKQSYNYEHRLFESYLNKSGMTDAYQKKPCLNPEDSDCPKTAPNYKSKQVPDIASLMTQGCHGLSKYYMRWPEQLILGGIVKNKTQHIKRAKAMQTVIQLMGNKDMYDYWADNYKVHHVGWNQEKAAQILDAWQKKFAQEVKRLQAGSSYQIFPFSMATLNESLKEHTNFNVKKLAIVVSLLMVYCMFMGQYMAVFGVVMLILNTIAGLGLCALLGIPLTILTIQVVPYLCVGLSLRDIWILLHSYKLTKDTKQTIKQCTPNITASNLYLAATFAACYLLPVPALKTSAMQCAVLTLCNTIALLMVFPAILSIDQRREQAFNNRVKNYLNRQGALYQPATKKHHFTKSVSECCCEPNDNKLNRSHFTNKPIEFLLNKSIKFVTMVTLCGCILIGIYHAYYLKFSLQMPEFLPRNCTDFNYLKIHETYFGFYSFSTVTMNINYPNNQYLIKEYYNSIANSKNVLSSESTSWLQIFQNYLQELQDDFEVNLQRNQLNSEKWHKNVTYNAILAFKLLANTGNVNHPIEKSEILTKKLVSKGLIEEEPWYNYFSAWYSYDPVVSFMKNTFRPHPEHFSDEEYDLRIPKTKALKYVETEFYVSEMYNTDDIIELITEVRKTSDAFTERGLRNYPKGLIFAFYDQFIDIFEHFAMIFGGNFLACFVTTFLLLNFNTSLFLIAFKMILIIFLAIGFKIVSIDMNIIFVMATSIAITILARNLMILIEGFVTSIGNRERRSRLSMELNLWPLFQGNLSFLISIAVFYSSDFDFIRKYLFFTFIITICVDSLSTFCFFPIFLSSFGPKPMLIPLEYADRIATPSPVPSPVVIRKHHHHHRSRRHGSHGSSSDSCHQSIPKPQTTREPSLTTITEESGCSITVQPEVVVQTTTYNNQNDGSNSPNNSQHVTTKVTATANIKVEVHSRPNSRREERDN